MSAEFSALLNLADHFVDARIRGGLGIVLPSGAPIGCGATPTSPRWSSRVAHVLERADIRPEERVIIALPDGAPFVGALFGILRRGAVVVMVNPDLQRDLLTYFLEYTRARAAFVDLAHREALESATASLTPRPPLFVVDDPGFQGR